MPPDCRVWEPGLLKEQGLPGMGARPAEKLACWKRA